MKIKVSIVLALASMMLAGCSGLGNSSCSTISSSSSISSESSSAEPISTSDSGSFSSSAEPISSSAEPISSSAEPISSSGSSQSSSGTSSSSSSIPTPGEVITVTDALALAKSLAEGETSSETFKIHGYVSNSFEPKESTKTSGQYNFDVVDTQGGEALIAWWLSGSRLPQKGEEVTLEAKLQHYVDTNQKHKYEAVNGSFTVGDTPTPPTPTETLTVSQALEIAKGLGGGKTSTQSYKIEGYVSNDFDPKESTQTPGQYNFDVVDNQGEEALIAWWLSGNTLPSKGQAVTIEAKLQHYVDKNQKHKYEAVNGSFTLGSTPTPPTPPTPSGDTIKYTFTSKEWKASPANWSSIADGYQYDKGAVQVNGVDGIAKSPISYTYVQSVDVEYFCNYNKTSEGTISIEIDDEFQEVSIDNTLNEKNIGHQLFDFSQSSPSGYVTFTASPTNKSIYVVSITVKYSSEPPKAVYPTSISVPSSLQLGIGKTKSLEVSYEPSNTNVKETVFTSDNSGVVKIENNKLVGVSSGNATITATAHKENGDPITATCSVSVIETPNDDYTILVYMCGSTLEYDDNYADSDQAYYATEDIQEMLSSSCPDGVNIVIETGGAKKWSKSLGINADYLERYHIDNKSLVRDAQLSNADMSKQSTLASFVEYGINEYPADKMALILWDHGNGVGGVCVDDKMGNSFDALTASEVTGAMKDAFTATNYSSKFEWIGYDACLMSYFDAASVNATYFNYMIASQELENGGGWDYKTSFKRLYDNPTQDTKTLLSNFAKDFVDSNGEGSEAYDYYTYNDQTMSVLDLSKMDTLVNAFESYVLNFVDDSSALDKIFEAYEETQLVFGSYYDEYSDYFYYDCGVCDFVEFLNILHDTYSSYSIDAVISAYNDVRVNTYYGDFYDDGFTYKPCGMSLFVAYGMYYSDDGEYLIFEDDCCIYGIYKEYYTALDTKLSNWRTLMLKSEFWADNDPDQ